MKYHYNTLTAQVDLSSFIVAKINTHGVMKFSYVGRKPTMTQYETARRRAVIANAFEIFNPEILQHMAIPTSLSYSEFAGGITNIKRGEHS